MDIAKEKIVELKKEHGEIYLGELSFTDGDGANREIKFVYRQPVLSDFESMQQEVGKNQSLAYRNLLSGVIVYPDRIEVMEQLDPFPVAITMWSDKHILPCFGGNVIKNSSKKL